MTRKNPFASLMDDAGPSTDNQAAVDYASKGATRSLLSSIDEMATQADRLLEGETIVELDPALIDDSFASDRFMTDEEYSEDYSLVLEAMRERGQDSPVLVRPHPQKSGRYMMVFGHLRRRVAVELGRKVRAVVKQMSDRDHVIAQGQENNGRANTSFIEKAVFAADIVGRHFDDDNSTVMSALGVDKSTLSKMLAVASLTPKLLHAIGRAKRVGRDRWYELKQLLDRPKSLESALTFLESPAVVTLSSDERFEALIKLLKTKTLGTRAKAPPLKSRWSTSDGSLSAEMVVEGRKFTLALRAKGTDAKAFGDYLSQHLDEIYGTFRRQDDQRNKDM